MQFDTISLLPNALDVYYNSSILGRAQNKKKLKIVNHDMRNWAYDKHRHVDDKPYGGGPGMVIRVDVVHRALRSVYPRKNQRTRVILLTPRGKTFDQRHARRLARYKRLILIAGRYEAIDARIEHFVDEKISLGNFVLTGGELAAACVIDAVARLSPGVLGEEKSLLSESYSHFSATTTNIEYPQYTKPQVFMKKYRVPAVLLSGHHGKIEQWRNRHSDAKPLTTPQNEL